MARNFTKTKQTPGTELISNMQSTGCPGVSHISGAAAPGSSYSQHGAGTAAGTA